MDKLETFKNRLKFLEEKLKKLKAETNSTRTKISMLEYEIKRAENGLFLEAAIEIRASDPAFAKLVARRMEEIEIRAGTKQRGRPAKAVGAQPKAAATQPGKTAAN